MTTSSSKPSKQVKQRNRQRSDPPKKQPKTAHNTKRKKQPVPTKSALPTTTTKITKQSKPPTKKPTPTNKARPKLYCCDTCGKRGGLRPPERPNERCRPVRPLGLPPGAAEPVGPADAATALGQTVIEAQQGGSGRFTQECAHMCYGWADALVRNSAMLDAAQSIVGRAGMGSLNDQRDEALGSLNLLWVTQISHGSHLQSRRQIEAARRDGEGAPVGDDERRAEQWPC